MSKTPTASNDFENSNNEDYIAIENKGRVKDFQ